jgi:hypothetical protein
MVFTINIDYFVNRIDLLVLTQMDCVLCEVRTLNPTIRGRTLGGAAGLQPPQTPQKPKFKKKNTDFVDIMISKALRDLPFSRNQPLKSADDSTLEF